MKYYKVSITEIVSTPACTAPKSKAIVELRGRQEDEEAAKNRAGRTAERFFMSILGRNKRVEKVSYDVNPIDKPASLPRTCTIIGGRKGPEATIWLTLEE